jgi:hypothetical protein
MEYWMRALKERVTRYHMYVIGVTLSTLNMFLYLCISATTMRACMHAYIHLNSL